MHVEKKDVLGTKSLHLTKCNAILKSPLNRAALKTTSTRALRLTFCKPQVERQRAPVSTSPGSLPAALPPSAKSTRTLQSLQIPKPLSQVTRWDKDWLNEEAGTGMPRVQNNSRLSPCPPSSTRPGESGGTT
ncbi:hypothetical protein mRhiFer1_009072 [Rhinolophus ferrumequinum]|uniref:Uncharacterized protein n=1 Tax=Rhinolophus ferrumequinum TaxID=59479 RepID=A0A7J7SY59_RHIFE|nr:hypothetical protein mRhiFer1_009072 [Rhinolophus ferrumequinum]